MATKPLPNVTEKRDEGTTTFFFPRVVHLRLQDQSLLKFAPGPREVPNNLHPAEMEILKRSGAKPIANVSKQVIAASEGLAAAHATGGDTVRAEAILAKAQAASGEDSPELTKEEQEIAGMPEGAEKEAAKVDLAAKRKAAKESAAKAKK